MKVVLKLRYIDNAHDIFIIGGRPHNRQNIGWLFLISPYMKYRDVCDRMATRASRESVNPELQWEWKYASLAGVVRRRKKLRVVFHQRRERREMRGSERNLLKYLLERKKSRKFAEKLNKWPEGMYEI